MDKIIITKEINAILKKAENEEAFTESWCNVLNVTALQELGNLLYKHRNDSDESLDKICRLLNTRFTDYDYEVTWFAFHKNIGIDFKNLMDFLSEILNTQLEKEDNFCKKIVSKYEYIVTKTNKNTGIGFKRHITLLLAPRIVKIAESICSGKIEAPEEISLQCKQLSELAENANILNGYISSCIDKGELFFDILETIYNTY